MSVSLDFIASDSQLSNIDRAKYAQLASDESIARFQAAAEGKKVCLIFVLFLHDNLFLSFYLFKINFP